MSEEQQMNTASSDTTTPSDSPVNDTAQVPTPPPSAEQQVQEYLAGWKRALADYENAKKEMARARQEGAQWAKMDILMELLPTLDALDAALKFAPDTSAISPEAKGSVERWVVGVKQVQGLLTNAFEQSGAKRISAEGLLDPRWHEGVGERPDPSPAGTILEVVAVGYTCGDRLLRAARVITSSGSPS